MAEQTHAMTEPIEHFTNYQQKYRGLTAGQKATLRRLWNSFCGCESTFYNKLAGRCKLRPIETEFLKTHMP